MAQAMIDPSAEQSRIQRDAAALSDYLTLNRDALPKEARDNIPAISQYVASGNMQGIEASSHQWMGEAVELNATPVAVVNAIDVANDNTDGTRDKVPFQSTSQAVTLPIKTSDEPPRQYGAVVSNIEAHLAPVIAHKAIANTGSSTPEEESGDAPASGLAVTGGKFKSAAAAAGATLAKIPDMLAQARDAISSLFSKPDVMDKLADIQRNLQGIMGVQLAESRDYLQLEHDGPTRLPASLVRHQQRSAALSA